jgi:prepilin-type N-terminal cleavage/methylation domain-containing protein
MFDHSKEFAQFCGRTPWAPRRTRPAVEKKVLLGTAERRIGLHPPPAPCEGFSLLEMMVTLAVMIVISSGIFSAISSSQQSFARTELKSDMYENVRGAAELLAQEIGQAGLVSLPASTLSTAVSANVTAQTVNVSSTTSMFVNEQVLVDASTNNEELVTLTAVTAATITTVFGKPHVAGVPINVLGVFPNGVVAPVTAGGSTANILNIFGDINADGSLVYVRYTCTPGTPATPGTLTRSVTTILPGVDALSASQTLLSTVVGGAGAVCFQYTTTAAAGFTFVTNVGFTLSVQATKPDPQTGVFPQMTKSFLNLAPRNVSAGLELANAGITTRLQPTPANVLVY